MGKLQTIIDYIKEHEQLQTIAIVCNNDITNYFHYSFMIDKYKVLWRSTSSGKYEYYIQAPLLHILHEKCAKLHYQLFECKGLIFDYDAAEKFVKIRDTEIVFLLHETERLRSFISLL